MALRIVTADERLSRAANKTTMALFGPSGVGKTTQLKTLPAAETICIDLEAGLKSVQDWRGDSIPVRCFEDAIDIACLIGGVNPAAGEHGVFSVAHYQHLATAHPDLVQLIAGKSIVFLDSITDLHDPAPHHVLAHEFSVSTSNVDFIVRRLTWKLAA